MEPIYDRRIVIDVRGGTVCGVYTDDPDAQVILVDWDEKQSGWEIGHHFGGEPMSSMYSDTKAMVEELLAEK